MKIHLFYLLFLLSLFACAPATLERKRYFWPPSADQAKIEYINFYESDRDVLRGFENHLAEAVFGIEEPKSLFRRPVGIGTDGKGRVFVTDPGEGKVLVLDLNTGEKHFLVDADGVENAFGFPYDIDFAADGQFFLTDSTKAKVLVYSAEERALGEFSSAELKRPTGIAVDSPRQRVYVVDTGNHYVAVFGFDGQLLRIIGGRGSGQGKFNFPLDVDVDAEGTVYILDSMNALVQKFDPEGNFLLQFGERGTAQGSFQLPKALAVSPSGHVYVTDGQKNSILIFDRAGQFLLALGDRFLFDGKAVAPGGFNMPHGIAIDEHESIWVVDSMNRLIHHFQYLNAAYLAKKPILPGQALIPPEWNMLREFDSSRSPAEPDGGTAR
jgi:DNA-binding beta-propeller fold protein YncE